MKLNWSTGLGSAAGRGSCTGTASAAPAPPGATEGLILASGPDVRLHPHRRRGSEPERLGEALSSLSLGTLRAA